MKYLAAEARAAPPGAEAPSLLFLTPCHATPLYSHLHVPLATRFLDCSPPGWAAAVARLNDGGPASSQRQLSHTPAAASTPVGHGAGGSEASQAAVRDTGQCNPEDSSVKARASAGSAAGIGTTDPAVAQAALECVKAATAVCAASERSERQLFEADPGAWLEIQYPAIELSAHSSAVPRGAVQRSTGSRRGVAASTGVPPEPEYLPHASCCRQWARSPRACLHPCCTNSKLKDW